MPTYAGFGPEGILGLDGSPLVNVEISVYEDGTNTLATLYSSSTGGAQANPVSTDSYGNLVFWLAGGDYELEYNGHRVPFSTYVTGNVEHAPQHDAGESDPISGLSPSQVTGTAAVLGANTFTGNQTLSNVNVVLGTTTGTKIGTATSQKLGFFNATPVIQQTGNALDALEALGLVASATLAVADITGLGTMATATASDYLSKAGNLGGIADLAVARTNLGLGTMATESANAYAALTAANTFTAAQTISANADTVGPMLLLRDTSANAASRVWRISNAMGSSPYGALGFQVGATAGGTPANDPKLIILSDGKVGVGITTPTSLLHVAGPTFIDGSTDVTQLRVQGVAGQSQPPITVENSSASVLASISAAGAATFNGVTVSAGYDINASHAATGTTRYGVNAVNSVATGTGN